MSDLLGVMDLGPLRSRRLKQHMHKISAARTTTTGTTTAAAIAPLDRPPLEVFTTAAALVGELVALASVVEVVEVDADRTRMSKLWELVAAVDFEDAFMVTVMVPCETSVGTFPDKIILVLLYDSQEVEGLSETDTETSLGLLKALLRSYSKSDPIVALALDRVLVNKV